MLEVFIIILLINSNDLLETAVGLSCYFKVSKHLLKKGLAAVSRGHYSRTQASLNPSMETALMGAFWGVFHSTWALHFTNPAMQNTIKGGSPGHKLIKHPSIQGTGSEPGEAEVSTMAWVPPREHLRFQPRTSVKLVHGIAFRTRWHGIGFPEADSKHHVLCLKVYSRPQKSLCLVNGYHVWHETHLCP